ncbi:hypothetical protein OROGR_003953 [Orobanche gracilis]
MERTSKLHTRLRQLPHAPIVTNNYPRLVKGQINKPSKSHEPQELNSLLPPQSWKGKKFLQEDEEEIMPDVLSFKISDESFEDIGSTSFHGVSHPPEPIDTDMLKPVYVPINRNNRDGKCLIKSLSKKGPFREDHSIRLQILDEVRVSSPFVIYRPSQNIDSEEKECVWDASLPSSGNVSPLSSIDSIGVSRTMSIANSCASTYRSEGIVSDGMLSVDKNYESTKGSFPGDYLESTKTSLSRASDSSGISDDSNWSIFTGSVNKPHKGNDPRWNAILAIRARDGMLGMSHFKLLRTLGCGDIGSVYLSELSATRCFFAMKVMNKAPLASRNKLNRAQTEREILQLLDHPFLPTLYTHFETDMFSCLVMEYCPGGDLHTLRQRQPGKHFLEYATRILRSRGSTGTRVPPHAGNRIP